MNIKNFVGKEVALFPHDSYKKNAILLSIDEYGYTFKITSCEKGSYYAENEIVFFNHANKIQISDKLNNIRKL
jgi:hypothetical protein